MPVTSESDKFDEIIIEEQPNTNSEVITEEEIETIVEQNRNCC